MTETQNKAASMNALNTSDNIHSHALRENAKLVCDKLSLVDSEKQTQLKEKTEPSPITASGQTLNHAQYNQSSLNKEKSNRNLSEEENSQNSKKIKPK